MCSGIGYAELLELDPFANPLGQPLHGAFADKDVILPTHRSQDEIRALGAGPTSVTPSGRRST